jgi:hypothetical protein
MSLGGIYRWHRNAVLQCIDSVCNYAEMRRVYTCSISAFVVDLESSGDCANENFIGHAVRSAMLSRAFGVTACFHARIAVAIKLFLPYPASFFINDGVISQTCF